MAAMAVGVLYAIYRVLGRLDSGFSADDVMDQLASQVIEFIKANYDTFKTRFDDPSDGTIPYFTQFRWDGSSNVSKQIYFHTDQVMTDSLWRDLSERIASSVSEVTLVDRSTKDGINFFRGGSGNCFASVVYLRDDNCRGFTLTLSTV